MSSAPLFHPEVLPARQLAALRASAPVARAEGFYLAGGTGLAVQFAHRQSVDLDWFHSADLPSLEALSARLRSAEIGFEPRQIARGTLHGSVRSVATSFFSYPCPLLRPTILWPELDCALASVHDIACMKLAALAQRGARKDFVDIFAIGKTALSLPEMLDLFRIKYQIQDIAHLLVALTYFDDAEREPMPHMLWDDSWDVIQRTILGWVSASAR